MALIRELLPPETGRAFGAMRELRGAISDESDFVDRVDRLQRPQGYRLFAAFERDDVVAVAGFRCCDYLAWGRALYLDDLSTLPAARRRGYAAALLEALAEEGRRLGCEQLHLDSAVGPERAAAHRLYLTGGYRIAAHHFARDAF